MTAAAVWCSLSVSGSDPQGIDLNSTTLTIGVRVTATEPGLT